uniref:Uncharacterized protein n=1 Tax=Anguilla anguilla TaxID=7936 RepID=A0A0E9T0J0_ANGAN
MHISYCNCSDFYVTKCNSEHLL